MWYNPTNLAMSCLGAWEGMGDPCYEYWRVAPRWMRQRPLGGRKGKFFPSLCEGNSFEFSQNLGRFTSACDNVGLFIIFTQRILQCLRPQAQNYGKKNVNWTCLSYVVVCIYFSNYTYTFMGILHILFLLFTFYIKFWIVRPCGLHMLNSVWAKSIYKYFFLGMVLYAIMALVVIILF
jgi:hypothetical protein